MAPSNEQMWEFFVSYMENNIDFARGRLNCPNAKQVYKDLWETLKNKLMAAGYGDKDITKWQKAWTDMKLRTKSKAAKIKSERSKTGGGQENIKGLTQIEERVLAIIGHQAVEGDANREFGIGATTPQPVTPKRKVDDQTPSTSGVKRRLTDKTVQVEEMHAQHMQLLGKIANTLDEINLKLDGISQAIQDQGEQITALNLNLNNIFQLE